MKITEFLNQIDSFFATIPEETIYVMLIVILSVLFILSFKYSNYSFEEFKKNLGL